LNLFSQIKKGSFNNSESVITISVYEHEKLVQCYLMIHLFCAYQLDIENRKHQMYKKIIKSSDGLHDPKIHLFI